MYYLVSTLEILENAPITEEAKVFSDKDNAEKYFTEKVGKIFSQNLLPYSNKYTVTFRNGYLFATNYNGKYTNYTIKVEIRQIEINQ